MMALLATLVCFAAIAGQLVRLAARAPPEIRVAMAEPLARTFARPDIVDRAGRLIAADVAVHSLYADPLLVLDLDETLEKLGPTLPGLDTADLKKSLADQSRRFVWVARGLSPRQAQRVHDLGLPGLAFRTELKRAYPLGPLAGHLIGTVNTDNKGLAGLERMLDETGRVEAVQGPGRVPPEPVRLSLDVGVQHALAEELKQASLRYAASGAAGLVLDANSGEVLAAVSLPQADPSRPADWLDPALADRLAGGTFELGSIFKALTVAQALEAGSADLERVLDVRQPLTVGTYTIKDLHPQGRPLTVREVFLHSSNVGAGMLALEAGAERQRAFLGQLGLTEPMRWEAGPVATPQLPKNWGRIETVTIGYGHGLALAPLQFAAGMAALVNGGARITPTLMARSDDGGARLRVVSEATSAKLREIMRLNVTQPARHRPARGGRGLSRRRQDRHGRDAGPRRLPGEVRHLLLRRRLPDGRAALRRAGDAVRAQDRRHRRRPHHGRPQRRPRHRPRGGAHRPPARRPPPPPRGAAVGIQALRNSGRR